MKPMTHFSCEHGRDSDAIILKDNDQIMLFDFRLQVWNPMPISCPGAPGVW